MNPITVHETNNKNCNNSRRRHEIRKEYRMYSYVNVIKFKCNYFDDFLYTSVMEPSLSNNNQKYSYAYDTNRHSHKKNE